jgi:hypothetical protein
MASRAAKVVAALLMPPPWQTLALAGGPLRPPPDCTSAAVLAFTRCAAVVPAG